MTMTAMAWFCPDIPESLPHLGMIRRRETQASDAMAAFLRARRALMVSTSARGVAATGVVLHSCAAGR